VNTTKLMLKQFKMNISPIKSEKNYREALKKLEHLFDAKKGTPEGDELEILSILIEKYEDDQFKIDFPDPIEAIKFRMEQMGYTQSDLVGCIGYKSRVSEILHKKRKLNLDMIRALSKKLNISTEVLVQQY
jgi:HTH-type transcriptional regulator/antitoxin HigA